MMIVMTPEASDAHVAAVRAKLGHEAFTAAWNAGQSRPLMETIVEALDGAPQSEGDVRLTADSPTLAGG